MKVLINGREARGPGAYVIGTLAIALVLAFLFFVVLPLIGVAIAIAVAAGVIYLGARTFGMIRRRRSNSIDSDEAAYRIESSRQHRIDNDD